MLDQILYFLFLTFRFNFYFPFQDRQCDRQSDCGLSLTLIEEPQVQTSSLLMQASSRKVLIAVPKCARRNFCHLLFRLTALQYAEPLSLKFLLATSWSECFSEQAANKRARNLSGHNMAPIFRSWPTKIRNTFLINRLASRMQLTGYIILFLFLGYAHCGRESPVCRILCT